MPVGRGAVEQECGKPAHERGSSVIVESSLGACSVSYDTATADTPSARCIAAATVPEYDTSA
jgi:hypothetical protein